MMQALAARKKEIAHAYFQIIVGCVIGAAAYPLFLVPNNIAPGGLTGAATILNYLFSLNSTVFIHTRLLLSVFQDVL